MEWKIVKMFEDPDTSLVVEVHRLTLRSPRYSVSIGRKLKADASLNTGVSQKSQLGRFVPVEVSEDNGVVRMGCHMAVVGRLLDAATAWIAQDAQQALDARIDRDLRSVETKAKPLKFASHAGKSADHRRRHERNLAERREKDRQSAHGGRK